MELHTFLTKIKSAKEVSAAAPYFGHCERQTWFLTLPIMLFKVFISVLLMSAENYSGKKQLRQNEICSLKCYHVNPCDKTDFHKASLQMENKYCWTGWISFPYDFFFFNSFCLSFFHFKACWCVFQEGIWTWKGSCTSGNLTYIVDVIRYLMQEMWINVKIIQGLVLAIIYHCLEVKNTVCGVQRNSHKFIYKVNCPILHPTDTVVKILEVWVKHLAHSKSLVYDQWWLSFLLWLKYGVYLRH